MKKIAIVTLMAMSVSVASAQYFGPTDGEPTQGGFNGPALSQSITTVKDAMTLRDDAYVKLRGKIVKHSHKDKYIFSDDTGSITVEIDKDKWRGLTINDKDLVEIVGEVDKDWNSIEIDVDYITKVQ
ncbi:YgiW/YdeI family stress tolerance OB fold protein [Wohlfahrtiimonas sp. G9077]|uniref:YgiW/YdeI family stress tolerance OB fold protein n=1 Tax=Wohlfahrtiimonas sp. G9077 TaxID=1980118 RepID=UPI000B9814CD|nr:NirD/YgiW/YdeI family stress tolerance protein [Wohlfahrtiimonas sp. G9077]OYQ73493.1 TIGR00156 family protein [Wohlfahrtiimonas sp. G9077]